jgi:hypothetical protein
VFFSNGRVEDEIERDEMIWEKASLETGTKENFVCETIYHLQNGRYSSQSGVE